MRFQVMKLQVSVKLTVKTIIEPFVYLFYNIYLDDCFRNVFSKKHRFSIMKQKKCYTWINMSVNFSDSVREQYVFIINVAILLLTDVKRAKIINFTDINFN